MSGSVVDRWTTEQSRKMGNKEGRKMEDGRSCSWHLEKFSGRDGHCHARD